MQQLWIFLKETLKTAFLFLASLSPSTADTPRWPIASLLLHQTTTFSSMPLFQHYHSSRKHKLASQEEAIISGFAGVAAHLAL